MMSASTDAAADAVAKPAESVHAPLAIRHILAPFDGSAVAECSLPFVAALARTFSARVTLLRVLEPQVEAGTEVDALEWEMARAEAFAGLSRLERALESQGLHASVEVVQGRAAEQIVHFAVHEAADLLVLSTHGSGGLQQWSLAGTVHKVIATIHASVLLIPARRFHGERAAAVELRKILVPLDCSARAEFVLPTATELARAHGAELILAHVVPQPEMPRRLPPHGEDLDLAEIMTTRNQHEAKNYLSEVQSRLSTSSARVSVRLLTSPQRTKALHQVAIEENVDLVVLCAHGSTGDISQRYGGVAAEFVQGCHEPTLILQDCAAAAEIPPERPGH